MVINESGLCAAMKAAFGKKSTGYKVALRCLEGEAPELVLSAPTWTAILDRANAPRKVLALIVEHLGELPTLGTAYHVQDCAAQAEIFKMAVPEQPELMEKATAKRTQITYAGYTLYQRQDNRTVYMVHPKMEDLLDSKMMPLYMADDGKLYQGGLISQIYIKPYVPMQGDAKALEHFAEHQWI